MAVERVELINAGASILTGPAETFVHFNLAVISLESIKKAHSALEHYFVEKNVTSTYKE